MVSMYYVGWVGVGWGEGDSQSYDIIASWGLRIGEIYVSVCKFSSPLLSQKRSYIIKETATNSLPSNCQSD